MHETPTPPSTSTVSVQTTKGSSEKKKHRTHNSSKQTPVENTSTKKSPVDISSDETVLIPSIYASSTSLVERSQTSLTSFSRLFDKTPVSRSDSEVSLSSSIKEEFNDPFTQSQTKEIVQKPPTKKHKSDKKETKSKSKSQSQSHKATSVLVEKQSQSPKTVAELRKTVDTASKHTKPITIGTPQSRQPDEKKSLASATYVPARHSNLPQLVSQPSTSAVSPAIYINPATQTNIQHNSEPQDPTPYRLITFYSGK